MGYTYYDQRTVEDDAGRPRRRIAEVQRVAAFRLDPSLNDVDVGGRIQPYRSLIGPKFRTYFDL
jgi:hypothetical protein